MNTAMKKLLVISVMAITLFAACSGGGSKGSPADDGKPQSPDTQAPSISSVKTLSSSSVLVTFDEEIDADSATRSQNFSLSSTNGAQTVKVSVAKNEVTITSSPVFKAGINYTLTVKDIEDLYGNKMAAITKTFSYSGSGGAPAIDPRTQPDADFDGDGIANKDDDDDDGDGLSDNDEEKYGTDPFDADSDNDGVSDGNEVQHGTDPLDPESHGTDADGDGLFTGPDDDFDGDGIINSEDPDDDNDGLSDAVEDSLGTNPYDADTDDDGLSDGTEVQNGSDPLDGDSHSVDANDDGDFNDPEDDFDGDGIANDEDTDDDNDGILDTEDEDPYNADTNNNGIPDGIDPAIDTDGDGTGNDQEDFDGDGITNEEEHVIGTDPNDTDTDGDGIDDNLDPTPTGGETVIQLSDLPDTLTRNTGALITVSGDNVVAYKYVINSDDFDTAPSASPTAKISLSSLNDGTQTLRVIAKKLDGTWQSPIEAVSHSWTVDTIAPVITLTNTPGSVSSSNSVTFGINGDAQQFKYRLDGHEHNGSGTTIELSSLSNGMHSISVIASDAAGNWSEYGVESASYEWKVLSGVPVAEIGGLPNGPTNAIEINGTVSSASEGVVSYKYALDGAWSAEIPIGSGNITLEALAEGEHTVSAIVKNEAGTWQQEPTEATFTIDKTAPSVSFDQIPTSPSSQTKPVIRVNSSADAISYRYSIDGAAYSSSIAINDAVPFSQNLLEGSHSIKVIAKDLAGNETAVANAATHSWTVDITPPEALFVAATLPSLIGNQNSIAIKAQGQDVVAVRYKLDDQDWSAQALDVSSAFSVSALNDSEHSIQVLGIDAAGNEQSQNIASYTFTVDTIAPVVSLMSAPPAYTSSSQLTSSVSSFDAVYYEYKLDGGAWVKTPIADEFTLGNLSESAHTLYLRGIDAAGNVHPTPLAYEFTVDKSAPTAVLAEYPLTPANSSSAIFKLETGDIEAYRYSLDAEAYSDEFSASTAINLSAFSNQTHTIRVIARDMAGNWQSVDSATTYSWVVDTIAPQVSLSGLPAAYTNDTAITVIVGGADVSFYKFSLDGSTSGNIDVSTPISIGTPSEGQHTLKVWGRDLAGNWQETPETFTFTADRTAPSSAQVSDAGSYSASNTLEFTWSAPSDATNAFIQVATTANFAESSIVDGLDGNNDRGSNTTYSYPANPDAGTTYYARVRFQDAAGNMSGWGTGSDGITLAGSVTAEIRNTSGALVSGATVTLKNTGGTDIQTLSTGSDGKIQFTNITVEKDNYALEVSHGDYLSATTGTFSVSTGIVSDRGIISLVPQNASNGMFTGTVVSANDGKGISGVKVDIRDWQDNIVNTVYSGSTGTFTSATLVPGTYRVEISKTAYYGIVLDNKTINGNSALDRLAICEQLQPYQVRVVVQWGSSPEDLDLHMVGPTAKLASGIFHIWWANEPGNWRSPSYLRKTYNEATGEYLEDSDASGTRSTASLVQDDTDKYGPEAINIFNGYKNGIYTYTVHNWSGGDWNGAAITARIYDTEGEMTVLPFPSVSTDDLYWKMFKIDIQGPNRSDKTLMIENSFGTLDHDDDESMNWQPGSGGITGFISRYAGGTWPFALGALALLSALFAGLYMYSKRRYADKN